MRAFQSLLSVLPLAGLGSAHVHISGVPIPKIKALFSTVDPSFCASQTSPVACLRSAGTPFCSSFLNIPTATVCTTVYVSGVAVTATVTSYVTPGMKKRGKAAEVMAEVTTAPTNLDAKGDTITAFEPFSTDPAVRTEYNTPARRVVLPRQAGQQGTQCFGTFSASDQTNLCSCLSIPTPTSTTTLFSTVGSSATVTRTLTTSSLPPAAVGNLAGRPVTVTQTSGSAGYTSTVSTNIGGSYPTSVIVVNVPAPAAPSTTFQTSGASAYTSTLPTTINNIATSIIVVNVPTPAAPSTTFQTSGASAYTSTLPTTINNVATSIIVVNVPTPAALSTSFQTSGTSAYTSTLATTINNAATSIVVVNSPAPPVTLPTVTVTSGTVSATTFTTTSINNGVVNTFIEVLQPSTPLTTTTQTSGNSAYTSTATSAGSTFVVVNVPTPSGLRTITHTSGQTAYTSTVATTVNNAATSAVVVNVPTPCHIAISDHSSGQALGYLDVSNNPTSGGTSHSCVPNTDYTTASTFYIDPDTHMLALSPSSGVSSVPLFSQCSHGQSYAPVIFDTNNDSLYDNAEADLLSDGTLRLANAGAGQSVAALCSGALYLVGSLPAGCTQVFLTPVYNLISYRTTTVTSGSVGTTITAAPAGASISNGGVVSVVVPVPSANTNPTACTQTGISYTVFENPAETGSTQNDPNYHNFIPSEFKVPSSHAIDFYGVTNDIEMAIPVPGTGPVYDHGTFPMAQNAIMFHGYFYASQSGPWTFTLRYPDDYMYAWFGTTAFSTWGNDNADIRAGLNTNPAQTTITLMQGAYLPIRILYGDGAGAVSFTMYITDPNKVQHSNTSGFFRVPCGANYWN